MAETPSSSTTGAVTDTSSLAKMCAQATELDLVFALDCTGSMGSYIASAQASVRSMIEQIVSAEKADVRFALVAYRDHPPQDSTYITKVYDFTTSVSRMRESLNELSAAGGGDGPEAVEDALHEVSKLSYRANATKIAVLIADAPPHGLGTSGDGFPDGCPLGLDPVAICRDLAAKGITLYTIGCEPSILPYKEFFAAMAHITGGQYCPLQSASILSSVIVGGAREEMSLERLMGDVNSEVSALGSAMDEEAQAEEVFRRLREKKATAKKLVADATELPEASKMAVDLSAATSMAEVRSKFKVAPSAGSSFSARHRSSAPSMPMSCAAPSCPAPSSSSSSGGGIMGAVRGLFSFGSSPPTARSVRAAVEVEHEETLADMYAPSVESRSAAVSSYSVAEEEVSLAQCKRMVKKSRARQGFD